MADVMKDKADVMKDTVVINFPTQYTKKTDKYYSVTGDEFLPEYEYSIVKNKKELVVSGKTNIYERIQAESEAVDINKLMERFKNGETDALDRVHGAYFDATDMPKNFAEMQQRLIAAEQHFNSLDPELREAFNNNPIEFFDSYGSDEFNAKIEKLYPSDLPDVDFKEDILEKKVEVINE